MATIGYYLATIWKLFFFAKTITTDFVKNNMNSRNHFSTDQMCKFYDVHLCHETELFAVLMTQTYLPLSFVATCYVPIRVCYQPTVFAIASCKDTITRACCHHLILFVIYHHTQLTTEYFFLLPASEYVNILC